MKAKILRTIISLFVFGLLTSCASIIHGPTQKIDITSQPVGAKVFIDGIDYGVTPTYVNLMRKGRMEDESRDKKEYLVRIELEGYIPYVLKLKREMDGWFLGNILFGGVIGIIVDASTGAMYKLTPDQIVAQMWKSTAVNYRKNDNIYLAITLIPDPTWEKIGCLKKI